MIQAKKIWKCCQKVDISMTRKKLIIRPFHDSTCASLVFLMENAKIEGCYWIEIYRYPPMISLLSMWQKIYVSTLVQLIWWSRHTNFSVSKMSYQGINVTIFLNWNNAIEFQLSEIKRARLWDFEGMPSSECCFKCEVANTIITMMQVQPSVGIANPRMILKAIGGKIDQ